MPTVSNAGIEIHYHVMGDGSAVVLLHSFLCSGDMWREQVGPLSRGWRVINIDVRGHGRSGLVDGSFSLYDMVDDACAVLDAAGIERAVWAGLSVGGMVALRAALRVPDRVAGLILIDTDAGPESGFKRVKYRLLRAAAQIWGVRPLVPQIRKVMFGPTSRKQRPELVAEWSRRFAEVDVPSMLRMLDALLERDDVRPELGRIDVPALVLVGAEDTTLPPERSRHIAERLPSASYQEILASGHLSALERPDAVTGAMTAFLRTVYGPPGSETQSGHGGSGRA